MTELMRRHMALLAMSSGQSYPKTLLVPLSRANYGVNNNRIYAISGMYCSDYIEIPVGAASMKWQSEAEHRYRVGYAETYGQTEGILNLNGSYASGNPAITCTESAIYQIPAAARYIVISAVVSAPMDVQVTLYND